MSIIESTISNRSAEFLQNREAMQVLVDDLNARIAGIAEGGGERARAKHLGRDKLLPRERVNRLVDPGSPFLEIGQFAGYEMYGDDNIAAGGLIAGWYF